MRFSWLYCSTQAYRAVPSPPTKQTPLQLLQLGHATPRLDAARAGCVSHASILCLSLDVSASSSSSTAAAAAALRCALSTDPSVQFNFSAVKRCS